MQTLSRQTSRQTSTGVRGNGRLFAAAAGGGGTDEAPSKGLFALPFMRRAQERRATQAAVDAAALLREMEAADARTVRRGIPF